jgi:hypothetical protein
MKAFFYVLLISCPIYSHAQRILQLEMVNQTKSIKYYEGSKITLKLAGSEEWIDRKIESIMMAEKSIIFDQGILSLDQISAIQTKRWGVFAMSSALGSFGTTWTGFALLDDLRKDNNTTMQTYAIGLSSMAAGYALNKLFFNRTNSIASKRYRLRLLDLSVY